MAKTKRPQKEKPIFQGHRKRLRKRFLDGGLEGFLDYEVVELLLTLGTPRRDCKAMAKEAIKKFRSLRQVLDASSEELQQIKGIGPNNIFGIKLFQALLERYKKEKIPGKISLNCPEEVVDYLKERLGKEKKEHFLVLALDSRNKLIKITDVSVGTLDANLVHPREVFKEVILAHAAQVILAHNHPSGDAQPSEEDLEITKRLVEAGKILGIEVLDHIIISQNSYSSFRKLKPILFK